MEGPPGDKPFTPTPEADADRIVSEKIGRAGTHQLDRELAEYLRELGDEIDDDDIA